MSDFRQKRKNGNWFHSPIFQGVVLSVAVLVFFGAYDRFLVDKEISEKENNLEEEINTLEERKKTLEKEVDYLSSDRGVEAEIRRQFDVAREGEQVVIIIKDEDKENSTTETVELEPETKPWYKFW